MCSDRPPQLLGQQRQIPFYELAGRCSGHRRSEFQCSCGKQMRHLVSFQICDWRMTKNQEEGGFCLAVPVPSAEFRSGPSPIVWPTKCEDTSSSWSPRPVADIQERGWNVRFGTAAHPVNAGDSVMIKACL